MKAHFALALLAGVSLPTLAHAYNNPITLTSGATYDTTTPIAGSASLASGQGEGVLTSNLGTASSWTLVARATTTDTSTSLRAVAALSTGNIWVGKNTDGTAIFNVGGSTRITTSVPVNDGKAHIWTLVNYYGTGYAYVDGVLQGTSTATGTLITGKNIDVGQITSTSASFRWIGDIDEVGVFNFPKYPGRFVNPTVYTGSEPGLIALYHFDSDAGADSATQTAYSATGFSISDPPTSVMASSTQTLLSGYAGSYPTGFSYAFDGGTTYATAGSFSRLGNTATGTFVMPSTSGTHTMTVYPTNLGTSFAQTTDSFAATPVAGQRLANLSTTMVIGVSQDVTGVSADAGPTMPQAALPGTYTPCTTHPCLLTNTAQAAQYVADAQSAKSIADPNWYKYVQLQRLTASVTAALAAPANLTLLATPDNVYDFNTYMAHFSVYSGNPAANTGASTVAMILAWYNFLYTASNGAYGNATTAASAKAAANTILLNWAKSGFRPGGKFLSDYRMYTGYSGTTLLSGATTAVGINLNIGRGMEPYVLAADLLDDGTMPDLTAVTSFIQMQTHMLVGALNYHYDYNAGFRCHRYENQSATGFSALVAGAVFTNDASLIGQISGQSTGVLKYSFPQQLEGTIYGNPDTTGHCTANGSGDKNSLYAAAGEIMDRERSDGFVHQFGYPIGNLVSEVQTTYMLNSVGLQASAFTGTAGQGIQTAFDYYAQWPTVMASKPGTLITTANAPTNILDSGEYVGSEWGTWPGTTATSTAQVVVNGTSGTVITGGTVLDTAAYPNTWKLPATVTIPSSGTITVTATNTSSTGLANSNTPLTGSGSNIAPSAFVGFSPTGSWTMGAGTISSGGSWTSVGVAATQSAAISYSTVYGQTDTAADGNTEVYLLGAFLYPNDSIIAGALAALQAHAASLTSQANAGTLLYAPAGSTYVAESAVGPVTWMMQQ